MAALDDVADGEDVPQRLRHLLTIVHEEMFHVEPMPHEWPVGRAFGLRNLVLVMRKNEVNAARVNVDRWRVQQSERHRRALDVPARTPGTEAEVPPRLTRLRRLPQNEVAGVLFFVLVCVD